MGCKPGAHRHNTRNECLQLRALLKLAYNALRQGGCMVPKELTLWIRAQKEIPVAERMSGDLTPDRAQQAMTRQEITEDDLREAAERGHL